MIGNLNGEGETRVGFSLLLIEGEIYLEHKSES